MNQRIVSHIRDLLAVLRDPVFIKQSLWMLVVGTLMVGSILINIDFLMNTYPDPPRPPDRILDLIPQNTDFVHYGEYFSQLQIVILAVVILSSPARLRKVPHLLLLLGIMFTIRGFAITLTPLAQITPPSEFFDESNVIAQRFYQGMFFSGHSSSALIQAFFFWNERFRGIRLTWFILPTALGQVASMIIGHQHYTIDIFAAFFVVYFVLTFDFMRLVPRLLRNVRWMPWYTGETDTNEAVVSPPITPRQVPQPVPEVVRSVPEAAHPVREAEA